jgi:hypothetical protein
VKNSHIVDTNNEISEKQSYCTEVLYCILIHFRTGATLKAPPSGGHFEFENGRHEDHPEAFFGHNFGSITEY